MLIKGDRSKDITIEAGDTILINAASQFIEIKGAVRRPAIYEVLQDETLNDIIKFSLGFNETANKSNISIEILDLDSASVTSKTTSNLDFALDNALSINVFNYLSEKKSEISVLGAVEKPGFYSIEKYKTLEGLINDLNFVDEYPWLAVFEQFDKDNFVYSSILFSLKDKETYKDINILPNSKVYFANINSRNFDVSNQSQAKINDYMLSLNHKGSSYQLPVYGKYSVKEFIKLLGLDMSDVSEKATYISPLESKVIVQNYKDMKFISKKYHNVSFRSPINDLIEVEVSGAVDYPGSYTLSANTTLSELYNLVGDFKEEAYSEGVVFLRDSIRERQLIAIQKSKEDLNKTILTSIEKGVSIDLNLFNLLSNTIDPENLGRIAGDYSPGSKGANETILFNGDKIIIPRRPSTINVLGEVLNPTAFDFSNDLSVRKAIELAGGFQEYADKSKVYVIKSNGIIERANRNIFQGGNITLEPGDSIIVPRKIQISGSGLDILVPLTNVLSNLAFSAAALDNLTSD